MPEFKEFPKIPRLTREIIITEKIDGTNALVYVAEDGTNQVYAGSRNRWITPGKDNFGFAQWVQQNQAELSLLGPGYHYGEWWGRGIGRGYDLDERRFSLFNTSLWSDPERRPACCRVVPVLYTGPFATDVVEDVLDQLRGSGSIAAPGYTKPEGVVIFHTASNYLFKKTLEKDERRVRGMGKLFVLGQRGSLRRILGRDPEAQFYPCPGCGKSRARLKPPPEGWICAFCVQQRRGTSPYLTLGRKRRARKKPRPVHPNP